MSHSCSTSSPLSIWILIKYQNLTPPHLHRYLELDIVIILVGVIGEGILETIEYAAANWKRICIPF